MRRSLVRHLQLPCATRPLPHRPVGPNRGGPWGTRATGLAGIGGTPVRLLAAASPRVQHAPSSAQRKPVASPKHAGPAAPGHREEDDEHSQLEAAGAKGRMARARVRLRFLWLRYRWVGIGVMVVIDVATVAAFYAMLAKGFDPSGALSKLPGAEHLFSVLKTGSKAATASQLAMAWVCYKAVMPLRIAVAVGATPFVARHLERMGWVRPPAGAAAASAGQAKEEEDPVDKGKDHSKE